MLNNKKLSNVEEDSVLSELCAKELWQGCRGSAPPLAC